MVQFNEYQCNAFDPALTYEIEFDPTKKAPMANLMVEYTKLIKDEADQEDNGV